MPPRDALTVNETIFDRAVLHGVRLEHVSNGTAKRVRHLLWQAQEDVLLQLQGRLERAARIGFDTGPQTTKRLRELSAAYRRLTESLMPETRALIARDMIDVAKDEMSWNAHTLDSTLPIKYEVLFPDATILRTVALRTPFEGKVLGEWTQHLGRQTLAKFNQQVKVGIINGESVEQIGRRLRGTRSRGFRDGVMGWQRYEAQTLARTAIQHAQAEADNLFVEENRRLIKGVTWSATLDSRTCLACAGLDGRYWKVGETHPEKPLHFSCRCRLVPVAKSFADLGISLKEIPEGQRWSMTGDVPRKQTYRKWIEQQTVAVQREALGPARYQRFMEGKDSIASFVNRQNRILTVKELRAREGR